jgi:ribosomal small subunit protein bTHX
MGKGDKRSKKGKIRRGTHGKRRPRHSVKAKKTAAPAKR